MEQKPIKIRWINPLNVADYDEPILKLLSTIKEKNTEVEVVSLKNSNSLNHLEYHSFEGLVTGDIVEIVRDASLNGFDGVVIGCFYDVGLREAREISGSTVVVGPCQASLQVVSTVANRFSVLVGREKWIPKMQSNIVKYGHEHNLASFRSLNMKVSQFQEDPEATKQVMIEQAEKAIKHDHAEAIILGCTVEFGFYEKLQQIINVPVIDVSVASFKMCETYARMRSQFNWKPSRIWSCEAPSEEEIKSLKLFDKPAPIGNRIGTL
jgi:allantoin racemase